MRIRFILTLFITLFTLQFANAQTPSDRVSDLDIIHLVTDANSKLNRIYKEQVQGQEEKQNALRKAIYAANTELVDIRSLLVGGHIIIDNNYAKLQKPLAELQTAIDAVEQSAESDVLKTQISNVETRAKVLKKMIAKLK